MENNYFHKYLKYRQKYFMLLKLFQRAGNTDSDTDTIDMMFDTALIDANHQFTINLFDNLDSASNIISPASLTYALGLLQLTSAGKTDQELRQVIGTKYDENQLETLKSLLEEPIKMTHIIIANKLTKINPNYLAMVKHLTKVIRDDYYKNKLFIQQINKQIEDQTNGLIKNTLQPEQINSDTNLVIINTIYFHGEWDQPFDGRLTTKMRFHRTRDDVIDMMNQINFFNYYENSYIQLVELPFKQKNLAMGIILPKKFLEQTNIDYTINNVPQFTPKELSEFINNLQFKKINLYIPKFTHTKRYDMMPLFKKMGLVEIFNQDAELDLMSVDAHVTSIVHEVMVIVDESADVPPGKTDTTNESDESESMIFKADHAFIYYVRHVPSNMFLLYGDYQGN